MDIKLLYKISLTVFCTFLVNSSVMAFSTSPDSDEPYMPSNWETSESAVDDAKKAVENDDFRLLGFAYRAYNVPGIDGKDTKSYIDKCGIRPLKGFSDVIKPDQPMLDSTRAREYAKQYNNEIIKHCSPEK